MDDVDSKATDVYSLPNTVAKSRESNQAVFSDFVSLLEDEDEESNDLGSFFGSHFVAHFHKNYLQDSAQVVLVVDGLLGI